MKERKRKNGCERNFKEDFLKSCPIVHLGGEPMTISENYLAIHLGGLSNRFYRNSVVCFREQKPFILKIVFSHTWLRHA